MFKFDENTMPGCTVWVDGIEIFGDYSKTSVTDMHSLHQNVFLNGSQVTFTRPTIYHLEIFATNGKRVHHYHGHGKVIDLFKCDLPQGCYIMKVTSGLGTSVKNFIVPTK